MRSAVGQHSNASLDDEVRFHLETETARLVRDGLSPAEAARRARINFGSTENVKERSRDSRGVRPVENLGRDLSFAFRVAAKRPGFTLVVVLSLALGVGATTAVFNLTYNVLLAPLAVPHPEQLITLLRSDAGEPDNSFTWGEYQALRAAPGAGTLVTVRSASAISFAVGELRELANVHFVSGGYLPLIGAAPEEGRIITQRDDDAQAPVVVLAHWFARRLFAGDSSPVGRTVLIRNVPFTVIGVMPPSFRGLEFPGWFTAAIPEGATMLLGPGSDNRGEDYGTGDARSGTARKFRIVGRLSGALVTARASLGATFRRCCIIGEPRQSLDVIDIRNGIGGGKNDIRPQARAVLAILLAAMTMVLVVVCCNIASLLLVRATSRQREVAVRLSLGASRSRILVQLLMESVPSALLGAAGALLVAAWCTSMFVRHLPDGIVGPIDASAGLGFRIVPMAAFTAIVVVGCVLAFATYPAVQAAGQPLATAIRLDARASRTRRQATIARGVVILQVAATLTLVTAAALFAGSLNNLTRIDGGFAADHVLLGGLEARSTPYEAIGVGSLIDRINARLQTVPGVRAAAVASRLPLFGGINWSVAARLPGDAGAGRTPEIPFVAATAGYFAAAGIRVRSGREFSTADHAGSQPVTIISAAFARKYFPGVDAVDHSFGVTLRGDTVTSVRIVGVVGDVAYDDLREPPEPLLYLPWSQTPGPWHAGQMLIRTSGAPLNLSATVRRAVEEVAPGMNVLRMGEMTAVRESTIALLRLGAWLATFVSMIALTLSVIGVYGVVAYSVSRRTSEIGIRLALGAQSRGILWLVARETILLLGAGVAIGVPVSLAANGALRSQLFDVSPQDPRAAGVAIVLLLAAGLVASAIPALRALRIDPRTALNAE